MNSKIYRTILTIEYALKDSHVIKHGRVKYPRVKRNVYIYYPQSILADYPLI